MKPFELYWFASTAVEDYILDQEEIRNPGSRPSRITPADRAQKHRVAVEDRDKRRPNQGDGGAGGVGRG
ncbi:hypothetical protein T440DRAFT_388392 [Plenodomus tracheiphilus IPT5]|uniref:Uncharacterized protein n=1 Tax=Plenodomus tracheiphilus IPT5 TaxID=1408161 RepID=A0A6A7BI01_9PLEO|nr:hypothetical protein T440DRAFT_388392 [Plenodomus tracheiphilus IPT5]